MQNFKLLGYTLLWKRSTAAVSKMLAGRLRGFITFASRAVTSAVSILNFAECADRDNQQGLGKTQRESMKLSTSFFQPRNGPTSWQFQLQPASASLPETSTPPKPLSSYRPPGRPRKEVRVSAEVSAQAVYPHLQPLKIGKPGLPPPSSPQHLLLLAIQQDCISLRAHFLRWCTNMVFKSRVQLRER